MIQLKLDTVHGSLV